MSPGWHGNNKESVGCDSGLPMESWWWEKTWGPWVCSESFTGSWSSCSKCSSYPGLQVGLSPAQLSPGAEKEIAQLCRPGPNLAWRSRRQSGYLLPAGRGRGESSLRQVSPREPGQQVKGEAGDCFSPCGSGRNRQPTWNGWVWREVSARPAAACHRHSGSRAVVSLGRGLLS